MVPCTMVYRGYGSYTWSAGMNGHLVALGSDHTRPTPPLTQAITPPSRTSAPAGWLAFTAIDTMVALMWMFRQLCGNGVEL